MLRWVIDASSIDGWVAESLHRPDAVIMLAQLTICEQRLCTDSLTTGPRPCDPDVWVLSRLCSASVLHDMVGGGYRRVR